MGTVVTELSHQPMEVAVDIQSLAVSKVALVTMQGTGVLPWGTNVEEHRINPQLIDGINRALDAALEDPSVHVVVVTAAGKFWSNGMDLKYISAHPAQADELQQSVEQLLGRILAFPLPTIAAINGHFVAAGAMLGLAFDFRVTGGRGLFFVPGIDIGLVYSPGMTALMTCKTPVAMHRDLIVYGKRFNFNELLQHCVVERVVDSADQLVDGARELAERVAPKGSSEQYRRTMAAIKTNLYKTAIEHFAVYKKSSGMGFSNVPTGQDRPTKAQQSRL